MQRLDATYFIVRVTTSSHVGDHKEVPAWLCNEQRECGTNLSGHAENMTICMFWRPILLRWLQAAQELKPVYTMLSNLNTLNT